MPLATATSAIACLLDPPQRQRRAAALLRGLASVHRAATADAEWWKRRGPITPVEADRLRAAFTLQGLLRSQRPPQPFSSPADVVSSVAWLGLASVEELWSITVDSGLRFQSRSRLARGGRASCAIEPVDVLRHAVIDQARGVFLVHNHPSGDPQPSEADLRFTARVRRGATALGIQLHDHIVVAGTEWVSELTGTRGHLSEIALPSRGIND